MGGIGVVIVSMWNEETLRNYEGWFQTPTGRFAFQMERRLVERMVSPWPRRGRRLLEVGCGSGLFMEVLYQAGFDVDGIDRSEYMIGAARRRMGDLSELNVGVADHLPFDDNEYDFVALITVLEFLPDPMAALREATRVARNGVLVAFMNRWSFYRVTHGVPWPLLRRSMLRRAQWFSPWQMRRMLNEAAGREVPMSFGSTLTGPVSLWRNHPVLKVLNTACALPFGAFGAVRADIGPTLAPTPVSTLKAEPGASC